MKKILSSIVIALLLIVGAQYSSARIYNPPASGLTSLTPWTENVSAGGFSLSNVLNLGITGTSTLATTTVTKFDVSGQTTLGNASSSALTVSGQTTLASTSVTQLVTSGKTGVGTSTPDDMLEVRNNNAAQNVFALYSNAGTSTFKVADNGNVTYSGVFIPRVVGYVSAASTTINVNTTDEATTTIAFPTTFVNPSGTYIDGSMFMLTMYSTSTQTLYWDTVFASSTDLQLPSSVATGTTEAIFHYNGFRSKWDLLGLLKVF